MYFSLKSGVHIFHIKIQERGDSSREDRGHSGGLARPHRRHIPLLLLLRVEAFSQKESAQGEVL